jgi:alpha-glucosidase (family GH31 glycosyl hydrolase)
MILSDPQAVSRGDQYLWGRDMLVAPVLEKGARERKLYLPQGRWLDFWTGSPCEGGREITREVNLETIPVFVRAGALVPFGPLKQYTSELGDEPLQIDVYPGADGRFVLYEDDGVTFNFRKGEYRTVRFEWSDGSRELTVTPEHGIAVERDFMVRIVSDPQLRRMSVRNKPVKVRL